MNADNKTIKNIEVCGITLMQGKYRRLGIMADNQQIQFSLFTKDSNIVRIKKQNIVRNEEGEQFTILDTNCEQGRRYTFSVRFKAVVELGKEDINLGDYIEYKAVILDDGGYSASVVCNKIAEIKEM